MRRRTMIRTTVRVVAIVGLLLTMGMAAIPAHADPVDPRQPPFDDTLVSYAYNDGDGRWESFWTGQPNTGQTPFAVYHQWEMPDGQPSSPESLDGEILGSPAATKNCAGQLHVFVVGGDHHLYAKWQITAGSSWTTDWYDMGGYLTSNPAAFRDTGGGMEVFARGSDNAIWTRRQTSGCGSWTGWTSLGGVLTDYPRLPSETTPLPEYTTVEATAADGNFWCTTRPTLYGSWGAWYPC